MKLAAVTATANDTPMTTVYVVGMEPLDQGSEATAGPDAVFTTRAAAEAWGCAEGQLLVGRTFWGGTVSDVKETYRVWEMELRE